MPEYAYVADDGEVIYRTFRMADHKPERIVVSRKAFTRVYGYGVQVAGNPTPTEKRYPVVSRALMGTPMADMCPQATVEVGKKHRQRVKMPVITSKEHETRIVGAFEHKGIGRAED
jgi:hypothetical protein